MWGNTKLEKQYNEFLGRCYYEVMEVEANQSGNLRLKVRLMYTPTGEQQPNRIEWYEVVLDKYWNSLEERIYSFIETASIGEDMYYSCATADDFTDWIANYLGQKDSGEEFCRSFADYLYETMQKSGKLFGKDWGEIYSIYQAKYPKEF